MSTRLITLTTTLALAAASFALPALAAEEAATTDIGTLDKAVKGGYTVWKMKSGTPTPIHVSDLNDAVSECLR